MHKSDVFWTEPQQSSPCVKAVDRSEGEGIDGGKGGGGESGHSGGATLFLLVISITTVTNVASSTRGRCLLSDLCGVKSQDLIELGLHVGWRSIEGCKDSSDVVDISRNVANLSCSISSGNSVELSVLFEPSSSIEGTLGCLQVSLDGSESSGCCVRGGLACVKLLLDEVGLGGGLGSAESIINLSSLVSNCIVFGD